MRRLAAVIALGALLSACGSGDTDQGTGTMSPTPSPSQSALTSDAKISVLAPTPGETVKGPNVTVRTKLEGGTLLSPDVMELRPDAGHIHVLLDGETVSQLGELEYVMKDVEPGQHILVVEYVAGNHLPFYPRIQQTVTFRVS